MALEASKPAVVILVAVVLLATRMASASDPEATTDFTVPAGVNASDVDGSFFTFKGFRGGANASAGAFKPVKAFVNAFPALAGLGVSAAFFEFQPGSENPPHTHPRGTELLYVLDGSLTVGFVDTSNKLYNATLAAGDLFVFPKGLVHFQVNPSPFFEAHALASFSSSNPGLVSLPATLFGSQIPSDVLAKAFMVDDSTISALETPFTF